ncbi:hypothetical protein [Rhodoferax sp.]|uniref:hypothetical protein n=1 Tax=Rhodoferax sp. TaxID=50421 RepID=UPI00261D2FA9|nr:hypothetical protein [Rhodoferax sp.]MDD4943174.1 hypothetical protein [Rhodoferax sp.]
MSLDMPRQLPRFIPTLTEVVDPASLKPHVADVPPDVAAIVAQVMQNLEPMVERHIQDTTQAMQRVLAHQCTELDRQWHEELSRLVQQAVCAELKKQDSDKFQK